MKNKDYRYRAAALATNTDTHTRLNNTSDTSTTRFDKLPLFSDVKCSLLCITMIILLKIYSFVL